MHNVNEQTLMVEHKKQARKKATGIDGVDKTAYDRNAEENIRKLVTEMKKVPVSTAGSTAHIHPESKWENAAAGHSSL